MRLVRIRTRLRWAVHRMHAAAAVRGECSGRVMRAARAHGFAGLRRLSVWSQRIAPTRSVPALACSRASFNGGVLLRLLRLL